MATRWVTIVMVAAFCWGGLCGNAFADWEVRRSSAGLVDEQARALGERRFDSAQAIRLIRGLKSNQIEVLLRRFDRRARARPDDTAAQLAHAQILLALHRWSDAAAGFGRAVELAPTMIAPRWGRARAFAGSGDSRAAVVELRAALGLARNADETSHLARELVTFSVAIGDVDAEVEGRRAWARARPGVDVTFDLALAVGRAGRPLEAADILAGAAGVVERVGADRARWGLAEGTLRAAADDLDGASLALARARRDGRTAKGALRNQIWEKTIEIARRRGALDDIKAELLHPRGRVEWEARARILDESGDLREAWAALDEAIRLAPRDFDLRRRRIAIARRVGAVDEMLGLYQDLADAAAKGGDAAPSISAEALDGLWRLGRPDAAGRLFDRMLGRWRGGPSMPRALAEAAGRWGDDRRADLGWTMVLRRNPRDDMATLALGEARFQRGQRRLAVDTWRTLLRGRVAPAEAHARLGEIFDDHEFREQALVEARTAVSLAPGEARHHRLLGTILERQAPLRDAENEWETVLRLAQGPDRVSERQQARAHLIALWLREGSARVSAKLLELEQILRQDAGDHDALTFLVELQLRTGRIDAAIAVMRDALTDTAHATGTPELILLLVRALRQVRRADEATSWLDELVRRFPGRARDARLQQVDIALAGHADERARAVAEKVAADTPGDPRVVLRLAAVQERLGRFDQALGMYRRLVNTERDSAAALALAALLARMGETAEQRALLRETLRGGADDEHVAEVGRRAAVLEEAEGTLESLETYLADSVDLNAEAPGGLARRRVLASLLMRLAPPAYRNQWRDVASRATLRRLARHGVRPLLDLISAPDAEPDVRAVEVLGMLGRVEAVPHLARIVAPDVDPRDVIRQAGSHAPPSARDDLVSVAVIALGRIGGEAARAAIEVAAKEPRPALRLPILWALGRVGGPIAIQGAKDQIAQGATDAGVVACLTLGRVGGSEDVPVLESVARDPARPERVRVAAIVGLGLGGHVTAMPLLSALVDAQDRDLVAAARSALAYFRTVNNRGGPAGSGAGSQPDDAVAILGSHVDPDALLRALTRPVVATSGRPTPDGQGERSKDSTPGAP